MTEVTVLGLGNMGTAIANAFAAHGRSLTVWNRTPGRSINGATTLDSLVDAIVSSPLIVVCVADNPALLELLNEPDVGAALAGRALVNLNTGTPAEAREVHSAVTAANAEYLDGVIPLYPVYVGRDDVGLIYSGPESAWRQHAPVLNDLGGQSWHTGENVEGAAAIDMSICISFYHVMMDSFLESATFAKRSGVPLQKVLGVARDCLDILSDQMAKAIEEIEDGTFAPTDQSSIDVHLHTCLMAARAMEDLGAQRELSILSTIDDLKRAQGAGLGPMSMPAITSTFARTQVAQ